MRCLTAIVCLCIAHTAFTQPLFKTAYLQSATYSVQQPESFSFLQNPAAMAWSNHMQAGLYAEQRFGLSELRLTSVAATLPFSKSHFGLSAQYCGSDAFNSGRFSFGYAQALGSKASVGAGFQYHQWSAAGYGSEGSVGFLVGAQVRLSDKLLGGFSVANPVQFSNAKGSIVLPAAAHVGLGYDVSKELFVATTISKTESETLEVAAACQYRAAKKLFFRIGMDTESAPFFFGGGFQWNVLRIDVVGNIHPRLGFTPGLQIVYAPKRQE